MLERLEHAGVGDVIDENADRVMAGSESDGRGTQRHFEILQLVAFCNIGCVERLTVMALGAEYSNLHRVSKQSLEVGWGGHVAIPFLRFPFNGVGIETKRTASAD